MCGLPGTGKSTSATPFREMTDWFVYSTDDYLEMIAVRQNQTYNDVFNEYIKQATQEMDTKLEVALKNNRNVIWDQTNLNRKKRDRVLSRFPGYHKTCWYFPLYTDQYGKWFNRLADRMGKTVPVKVIQNMILRFEMPVLDEGFHELIYKDTGL